MSAKKGERFLGPYHVHNGYRVVEVDANGKRHASLHTTEDRARRYIDLMTAALEKPDHTTESAWNEYRAHLVKKRRKPDSIATCEWALRLFFPDPVPLGVLTETRCQRLYDELQTRPSKTGKPLAADSHRTALAYMKALFAWCAEKPRNWIKESPFEGVKPEGELRRRGKSLGKSGHKMRIKEARQWADKAHEMASNGDQGAIAALVAMYLGMRASEIVALRVSAIGEDQAPGDLLYIDDGKSEDAERDLEVPEPLRPLLLWLAEGRGPERPLFEAKPGVAHCREWVRKVVHRVCDAAELPRVTAHAMRGMLATIAAERGTAGHVIAATLGHSSYEGMTLKAYAAPGAHQRGVNRRGLVALNGGLSGG